MNEHWATFGSCRSELRPAAPLPRSSSHQKFFSLLERHPRHGGELVVGGAADGMADYGKAIVGHSEHAAHHLGGGREARGHDAEGRNQETFSRYGVVQTAR